MGKLLHQLNEPLAFSRTQEVLNRNVHIFEIELGGVLSALTDLVQHPTPPKARSIAFDQNQRDSVRSGSRVGLGDDDDQVGLSAIGDECLGTVDNVFVSNAQCLGRNRLEIGARAWLRHRNRANHLTSCQSGQKTFLLLVGAILEQVVGDDSAMQRRTPC
ncbi:Uncharacterised protein [Mycobacteroides abscessus subsp. abscessus]|nr:Uncharacterised protein [Mycobacteroides abscessus subsp. abscessus]SIF38861.1 Uncharacterised protein [Mycobacteroides abscessus subsp. abscessus]